VSELRVNDITNLGGTIPDGVGRIVQIVRATDTTLRSTSSTSFVDASISVTITPNSASNNLAFFWTGLAYAEDDGGSIAIGQLQITDSSNVALSGAEFVELGDLNSNGGAAFEARIPFNALGFVNAGSTSALTFKGRFKMNSGAQLIRIQNDLNTGQMIVMEVAA